MTEDQDSEFLRNTYRPYIQSVIDHISSRMESADVFDPRHFLATEEELSDYGMDKIVELTDFYGITQKVHFNVNQSLMLILTTQKQSGNCFVG